jgi:ketosteroid isomerase-like protein
MKGDVMSVTLFGDSAVASGLIDASWKDEHGQAQQMTVRFLAVLAKQKGEWKLVATQSTRFNKPSDG